MKKNTCKNNFRNKDYSQNQLVMFWLDIISIGKKKLANMILEIQFRMNLFGQMLLVPTTSLHAKAAAGQIGLFSPGTNQLNHQWRIDPL
jgi:hypothetical protein